MSCPFFFQSLVLVSACALATQPLRAALTYNFTFEGGDVAGLVNHGAAGGTADPVGSVYDIAPAPMVDRTKAFSGQSSASLVANLSGNTSYAGSLLLPASSGRFRMDSTGDRMTVSAWINWDGAAGSNNRYGIVNTMNSSQTTGWAFYIDNHGKPGYNFIQASSGRGRTRVADASAITPGKWTHIAMTWDASVGDSSAILLYVNGVLQRTTGASLSDAVAVPGVDEDLKSLDIALGSLSHPPGFGGSFALNGNMDDYAMWDTVLSPAELRAIYTASIAFPGCTAALMDQLINAYRTEGSCRLGGTLWGRVKGFDITGRALGDTWRDPDGRFYIWLGGDGREATGLMGQRILP